MKSCIFLLLIVIVVNTDSKPHKSHNGGERQISFVIPAYGFLGGGGFGNTNINPASSSTQGSAGFANLLTGLGGLGGVSTRTIFRTVTTVTVATVRTCTQAPPAGAVACGGRRRRDLNAADIAIEPTMVLVVGDSSITNQEQVSRILGLQGHEDNTVGNTTHPQILAVTTLQQDQDPTTVLYPTPASDLHLLLDDEEATTTNTPLTDFWADVNKEDKGKDKDGGLPEDEKARLAFGQSTTTVTVSMTGIAYTTVSSPVFTVSYAGCSPISFPVTSSAC